ncbi:MAG: hypothetical protein NUV54_00465 [Candidatus Taylorbacteria bacterium]|nr:hypothetical protein [Candidatus Taylorbacteria bacterium]
MRELDLTPEKLEHMSKSERRSTVSSSGLLEAKRFLLFSESEIRERLHVLRRVNQELSARHSEIIALMLHGSSVKGYSNSKSDIDGYLLIDKEKLGRVPSNKNSDKLVIDDSSLEKIERDAEEQFKLVEHSALKIIPISEKSVVDSCRDAADPLLVLPFYLALDKKINKYRELIISTLEQMGETGQINWTYIMEELWKSEGEGLDETTLVKRKNLYPKTLQEGREYFLRQ